MASKTVPGLCVLCNKANANHCSRCKSIWYCSKDCQRRDWPSHKLLCAAFAEFDPASRPDSDHIRAILFPVQEKTPKLVWLHCEPWSDGDCTMLEAKVELFLGKGHWPVSIEYNKVLKRDLTDMICVSHRSEFRTDGSKPNECVIAMTAAIPGSCYDWRGPLLAFGRNGVDFDELTSCRDLDMTDFRHLTDFFSSYLTTNIVKGHAVAPGSALKTSPLKHITVVPSALAKMMPTAVRIKGIRINCRGDRETCQRPRFESVQIAPTEPIFSNRDKADFAARIGLAIFMARCPPDARWANDDAAFDNPDASNLHICCDPNAKPDSDTGFRGWGTVAPQWQHKVGSVIVVRQDEKPLQPLHVEALARYAEREVAPLMAHSLGDFAPEVPMEKEEVLLRISRPGFAIFWRVFLQEKLEAGEAEIVVSPYEV